MDLKEAKEKLKEEEECKWRWADIQIRIFLSQVLNIL